jgi:hypothetical protein
MKFRVEFIAKIKNSVHGDPSKYSGVNAVLSTHSVHGELVEPYERSKFLINLAHALRRAQGERGKKFIRKIALEFRDKLLVIMSVLLTLSLHAQESSDIQKYLDQFDSAYKSAQDTLTTYSKTVYERIDSIKENITLFSSADQKTLSDELTSIQATLPDVINAARKDLDDAYNTYKNQLQTSKTPEQVLPSLVPALARIPIKLKLQIEPKIINLERIYTSLKTSQTFQEKRAYQEQMRKFFQSIAPLLPLVEQARKAGQKVIEQYNQTQQITMSDVTNVTKQFENVIDSLNKQYKSQNIPVTFGKKSNFVSLAFQRLISFYLDDLGTTLRLGHSMYQKMTQKKQDKTPYYKLFYDLVQRIQGNGTGETTLISKGYNGEVAALAEQYFPDQKDTITIHFAQQKQVMSIDAFGNALWDLSVSVTDPGPQDVIYANGFYREIMDQLNVVEPSRAAQSQRQANGYMASLYLNRAQANLKKMKPDKDTSDLLNIVIDSYQQASTYFKNAGNSTNQQLYQNLVDNLQNAVTSKQQGQQAEQQYDIARAILAYQKAFNFFSVGGDAIDAAAMQNRWNELNAQYSIKEAQDALNNFVTNNKIQLQAYMVSISVPTVDQSTMLSQYDSLFSDLSQVCKNAIDNYKKGIASLETLNKSTKNLEDTIQLLQFLVDGLDHLNKGDEFAQLGNLENLENAEYNSYPQALFNARNADALYSEKIKDYVIVFPALLANDQMYKMLKSGQVWNFELLFNRHCAKRYSEVAQTITNDPSLLLQYISAADGTRMIYLSNTMELSLTNSLEYLLSDSQLIVTLRQQALDKQAAALKLPTQAWQQDANVTHFYLSTADSAWREVLKRFATLWVFGRNVALRNDFLNAAAAYAKTYLANVPAQFYPSIGTALIHFRQYVVYTLENQTANAQAALQEIQNLTQTFFDAAQQLIKKVESPDLISSATDNQLKLVEWQKRFDESVADQNAIIAQLSPKTNPAALQLLTQTIDENSGIITCKVQPPGQQATQTLTLPNPEVKLADIYKKLGDDAYKKQNYKDSYFAYWYAMNYYRSAGKLNMVNQLEPIYNKAYTRSIYHAYLDLVVPNTTYPHAIKQVQIANTSVPNHYELYNSLQELPKEIPLPSNLIEMANDTSQQAAQNIQNILQGFAYLLFLYNRLTDAGIDYQKVVRGTQLKSLGEIQQEFSTNQIPLVIAIVQSANYYLEKLKKRLQANQSTIHLLQEKNKFMLAISYLPIMAATPLTSNQYMTQKPYKTYFPADTYFSVIRLLSDPNQEVVIYGSRSFTSGQELPVYNQAVIDLGVSNLAAAGAYQRRLDFLEKGGNVDEIDPTMGYAEMVTLTGAQQMVVEVKKIKKDDFSASIMPYQNTIALIQGYGRGVVADYLNGAYDYYQQANNDAKLKDITGALSKNYLDVANILQNFLIGDPNNYLAGRGTSFSGLIVDIQRIYQLAYALDKTLLDQVETTIAKMYESSGDLLAAKKQYFSTLPFYKFGISAFYAMNKPDQQKLTDVSLKLLAMYFKGSMEQLMIFRDALIKPINMPDDSTLSLENLIKKSQKDETIKNEDPYKNLHDSLLDATIYFSDGSGWASIFTKPKGQATENNNTQDLNVKDAKDLLQSYTEKNNISFKETASIIELVKRPDFAALMQGAFDQFSQKVRQATNDQDRYIGYTAISQLANNLYFALGKLYMNYFLSAFKPDDQFIQWTSAIETEKQNILAPPDQWLGKQ